MNAALSPSRPLRLTVTCATCRGNGEYAVGSSRVDCQACDGSGLLRGPDACPRQWALDIVIARSECGCGRCA
jgi:hypothetical protein